MIGFFQQRPALMEKAYDLTVRAFTRLDPLFKRVGYERVNRWIDGPEHLGKTLLFDCQMCGQCVLHSTGMTCPMNCPKNLRNGPCGGVRPNGHCEVKPEMRCVWVMAYESSLKMPKYGHEMTMVLPPVNRRLEGSSAWVNMLTGVDQQSPPGWIPLDEVALAQRGASPEMLAAGGPPARPGKAA